MIKPLSQHPLFVRFAWIGVIVLLLLTPFVAYGLWCHVSGIADLKDVQERHAKEGRGSTLQDLLADIPDSDAERHEQWWRWQRALQSHSSLVEAFWLAWESDDARKWKLGLSADPPQSLLDAFSKVESLVSEVESLLDAGPFIAGMAGHFKSTLSLDDPLWLVEAYAEFSTNPYEYRFDPHLHPLSAYAIHFATAGLGYRALASNASGPEALRRMGKLIDACSHPLGMAETMILQAAITRTDDTYLATVFRQSLPEDLFATWLADARASQSLERVAKGFRGERLMQIGLLIPLIREGALHRINFSGRRVITPLTGWMFGSAGLAICSDTLADVERRIEQGPKYAFDLLHWSKAATRNPVASRITPNLIETGITAAESQHIARRTRIIALIVRHAMSASLPADTAELQTLLATRASWLNAADDQCAMSYTRLALDRFRIGIDLTKSTNGVFTPLDRYRRPPSPPLLVRRPSGTPAKASTPPAPPRTDLPPNPLRRMGDVEIWMPTWPKPSSE